MAKVRDLSFLRQYEDTIGMTDRFSNGEITPILMGLYGEVGSIMAASKKFHREKKAYAGYKVAVEEEFGDAFWYFSALCRRLSVSIQDILDNHAAGAPSTDTGDVLESSSNPPQTLDSALIGLGSSTAKLLEDRGYPACSRNNLISFAKAYIAALETTGLDLASVVEENRRKALGRFSTPDPISLPNFDASFPEEEQLPQAFEIRIAQRKTGNSYMRWNGVFIGSPLTDNIRNPDGYRFHDVFHMTYAAVLHWSPTFRALIKKKRKSHPPTDEQQDGGRAIVVEEGLTAWLFSYAQGLDNFEGHSGVSFDVLKTIQKFVQGYEIEACPLKLWEDAILQGYAVFRELKRNEGGIVVGDRVNRRISYRPIGDDNER
jgi:hypothetical protein